MPWTCRNKILWWTRANYMTDKGAKPKPAEITARFIFQNRIQTSSESVTDYHLTLKELATNCDFKENLEERLRDQLVIGLYNTRQLKNIYWPQKTYIQISPGDALWKNVPQKTLHPSSAPCRTVQTSTCKWAKCMAKVEWRMYPDSYCDTSGVVIGIIVVVSVHGHCRLKFF